MEAAKPLTQTLLFFMKLSILITLQACVINGDRSFTVDYDQHTLRKDGQPFHYVSGSIHYSRVPYYYWRDRVEKMRAAGLDAVQIYVPWNIHEPSPGSYDFTGQQDIVKFIQTCQEVGLLAIVRAGPYICGEWDFGGFPAWLLAKNSSMKLRTMDAEYIHYVDQWFSVLLPKIRPLLYNNGGNVLMVQVENEYGSYYACDQVYLRHLVTLARGLLGNSTVIYTTDGDGYGYLKCGSIRDRSVFSTVDFGVGGNASNHFAPLEKYQPGTPWVNSEFYTGWLDFWGAKHAHTATAAIVKSLQAMLDVQASVNMYMFEGGTNFGFWSGADPGWNVCPTSYDYDAPLTEAGDVTDKFLAIRQLLAKYKPVPDRVPPNTPKYAYGDVTMTRLGDVVDLLPRVRQYEVSSLYPLTQEAVGQSHGFTLYTTRLPAAVTGTRLSVPGIRDMGYVLLDQTVVGVLDRKGVTSVTVSGRRGQTLRVLVENQGRINFGNRIDDNRKGITSNVTLAGRVVTSWHIAPLNFTRLAQGSAAPQPARESPSTAPAVYQGTFYLPRGMQQPADTYLNPSGWGKGQAYVNGFNLGRYWPGKGPQVTLYVPGGELRPYPAPNWLTLVELQHATTPPSVRLTTTPIINATTAAAPRTLNYTRG